MIKIGTSEVYKRSEFDGKPVKIGGIHRNSKNSFRWTAYKDHWRGRASLCATGKVTTFEAARTALFYALR